MKEISREELFELVWRKPMTRLAEEFGLSDQGLSKICARLAIPKPPPGYWAKLEAGKEVERRNLPPCPAGTTSIIRITQSGQFQKKSREGRKRVEEAAVNIAKISIPGTLSNLHPIVAAWVDEHRKEQVELRARFRAHQPDDIWLGEEELADLTERDLYRFRVTSALLKGFEAQGGRVLEGSIRGKLRLEASGEKFEIAVVEKMYQFHGRPSDEPKGWTAYPYHHNCALAPTGFLRFTITTYLGTGVKKEWVETSKLNGGELLPTVIAGLMLAAPALAARSLRNETVALRPSGPQKKSAVGWFSLSRRSGGGSEIERRIGKRRKGFVRFSLQSRRPHKASPRKSTGRQPRTGCNGRTARSRSSTRWGDWMAAI